MGIFNPLAPVYAAFMTTNDSSKRNGPGRPRDAEAADALKAAALRLVRERGYSRVTIGALTDAAGVSRQTLYNRWPSKAELVMDAFYDAASVNVPNPGPDVPGETALTQFLSEIFEHLKRDGDCLRSLVAAAQDDTDFRDVFWQRFVAPRSVIVKDLLRRSQTRGELAPDRDIDILSNMIHGAFWYRSLNGQPLGAREAQLIARDVFRQ
ncbi:TetR/AcrR family transcriptional regulator [Salipiger sp. 1_MG-2023]|uniref:TetR/AcrR family transcriptional regulator n=1 Tax=Salipiger sp. 1_MG-2023 TaxID=3062665 RepID=UPI0026E2B8EC|nr:TetR/AcrR family transcriptional regulator [Salipiger sp. 1_MG-2023]MDO6585897.1 TetR/AcrR family transcriptional regulator [Salipiger sp. 1_MG-2023]